MKKSNKVALYTLSENERCIIQNKTFLVTATRSVKKQGTNSFESIYLKQVDGNEFVFAPAGLIVTKVE